MLLQGILLLGRYVILTNGVVEGNYYWADMSYLLMVWLKVHYYLADMSYLLMVWLKDYYYWADVSYLLMVWLNEH